jgi:glycosyltransferase involved in cell wall biosynthesis
MVAQHKGLTLSEDDLTSDSQILILTKVEDKQLKTLYQGALATCYVSHYEGFGLPALEAMAAGSPLVVSNNSSLPEITGSDDKAALSVDSTDTSQIVNALQSLIHNPQLRQSLKFEARKRAKPFTWKRTAELTWDVYQEVVKSSRAGER